MSVYGGTKIFRFESIITKFKSTIGERKDIENALAEAEDNKAFKDYIAVCDHPELLDDEPVEEVQNE